MNHEILVVEDDEGIREAIAIYLLHAGFHVLQAENGLEGLEVFRKHHPAMAVVDIMMPEMDGFTMVSRIRETSDIPVLFLSAKSEDVDKLHGFTIGADDYLTKPFSSVELVARVKARMRRYEQILERKNGEEAPAVLTNGGLELNPASKEVFVNGDPVHLTPKEFAILELLMRHPGQVFSAQQIYERIWKEEAITTATITVHIRKLREKIEAEPQRPQYIQVVWSVGYKIRKDT